MTSRKEEAAFEESLVSAEEPVNEVPDTPVPAYDYRIDQHHPERHKRVTLTFLKVSKRDASNPERLLGELDSFLWHFNLTALEDAVVGDREDGNVTITVLAE